MRANIRASCVRKFIPKVFSRRIAAPRLETAWSTSASFGSARSVSRPLGRMVSRNMGCFCHFIFAKKSEQMLNANILIQNLSLIYHFERLIINDILSLSYKYALLYKYKSINTKVHVI